MPYQISEILAWARDYRDHLESLGCLDLPLKQSSKEDFVGGLVLIEQYVEVNDFGEAVIIAQKLVRNDPFLDGMRFLPNLLAAICEVADPGGAQAQAIKNGLSGMPGVYDLGSNIYVVRSDQFGLRQANITLVSKTNYENVTRIVRIAEERGQVNSVLVEGTGPSAVFIYNRAKELQPEYDIRWTRGDGPLLGYDFPTELIFYPFQDMAHFLEKGLHQRLNGPLNPYLLASHCFSEIFRHCAKTSIPSASSSFSGSDAPPDLHILTYGISPGHAPLVGELHGRRDPDHGVPGVQTPWMRPPQDKLQRSSGADPPLCLVSGASGGGATALMSLFARRIPADKLDAAQTRLVSEIGTAFPALHDQLVKLVSACATELIGDPTFGREYEPRAMNAGAWSAMQEFCNSEENYRTLFRLLKEMDFDADFSLVLHARGTTAGAVQLEDPFRGSAGPLLSLINYPLLKHLQSEGRLVLLDSRSTCVRYVGPDSLAQEARCKVVISTRNAGDPEPTPQGDQAEVRDRWKEDEEILVLDNTAGGLAYGWAPAESARLPVFDHVCLSYGPRPDAYLTALSGSKRLDVVRFLRAMADGFPKQ